MTTKEFIAEKLNEIIFNKPTRSITLYTGVGGADMLDASIEKHCGFSRVYIGRKVLRFLSGLKLRVKKSKRNVYYRLIKTTHE